MYISLVGRKVSLPIVVNLTEGEEKVVTVSEITSRTDPTERSLTREFRELVNQSCVSSNWINIIPNTDFTERYSVISRWENIYLGEPMNY